MIIEQIKATRRFDAYELQAVKEAGRGWNFARPMGQDRSSDTVARGMDCVLSDDD